MAVLQTAQSSSGPDPQAAVAGAEESGEPSARNALTDGKPLSHEPYAIEPQQAFGASDPDVPVGRLRDRGTHRDSPIVDSPGGVSVLRDSAVRIECVGVR